MTPEMYKIITRGTAGFKIFSYIEHSFLSRHIHMAFYYHDVDAIWEFRGIRNDAYTFSSIKVLR